MSNITTKGFFKPEDFNCRYSQETWHELAADIANEKLNKLIESWPVVYGEFQDNMLVMPFGMVKGATDSHTARLAFIEKIKKECVNHEPEYAQDTIISFSGKEAARSNLSTHEYGRVYLQRCKHCGVELQATWTAKE